MRSLLLFPLLFALLCISKAQQPAAEDPASLARKALASLTLERKAAQLVWAEISGQLPDDDPRVQQWMNMVKDHGIGGFVIYGGTPERAAALLNKLQQTSAIPLLISTDFEGGSGQQFAGATEFPPAMAFAATRDEDLMHRAARVMAKEGRAIGVHLSYSPVVDISVSPDNPQESGRSFGGDLAVLNTMVKAYVAGYHQEGMLVTAKHFPGRGDMKGGPAYPSFTTINKDMKQLEQQEFKAFSHAVAAGVDFVMTEHIAIPSITAGSNQPASVEPKLVKDILRDKLGFKGLVVTDDLWYDHVVARFGREEVAVMALEAGHDIVLKPKDPVAAIGAIVAAVNIGRISRAQIDSSVFKLLSRKFALGLPAHKTVDVSRIASVVGIPEHLRLAQDVADRSVTMLRNNGVLPLKSFDPAKAVHITVQKTKDQPNVARLIETLDASFKGMKHFSIGPEQDKRIYGDMLRAAGNAELVVVSLFVQRDRHGDAAPLTREISGLLDGMASSVPGKVLVMSFGNPHLINRLPKAHAFLTGYGEGGFYGNQTAYFTSLVRILKGELAPSGKLPLQVGQEWQIGSGLKYTK